MPNIWDPLLRTYNFTNLPSDAITPSGGVYEISYTFLTQAAVATIDWGTNTNYYGASSNEETFFRDLTDEQKDAIATILSNSFPADPWSAYFADVAKITFTAAGSDGAIAIGMNDGANNVSNVGSGALFTDDNETAAATYEYGSSTGKNGDVWFNEDFTEWGGSSSWTSTAQGTDAFRIILHELGHALGLTGDGQLSSTAIDSIKYTVMSYGGHEDITGVIPDGLQLIDIAAIQSIYGRNYATPRH